MTEWRPVIGFEGRYEVSDDGQVKVLGGPGRGRFNRDRILKVGVGTNGYYQVLLYSGGGAPYVARKVHHLVLETFVVLRPNDSWGLHANDDRLDNRVANLRWGSRSENSLDMVGNGNHNHARKIACKWGHPFNGDNLRRTTKQRVCRECARRRNAEYEARKYQRSLAVYAADTAGSP